MHSPLKNYLSTEQADSAEPAARNAGNREVCGGTVSRKTDGREVTEEHFDDLPTKNYPTNRRENRFGRLDGTSHRPIDLAVWQMDGLARLHEAAARHGGECLADEYVGANPRYRFRCIQGHEWETKAAHILAGSWCKACLTQSQRLTLEDARRIAAERGGQCLSAEYIRCQEKLHWLCHRGHSWHSAFSNIRSGRWCPTCGHMDRLSSSKSKVRQRYEAYDR